MRTKRKSKMNPKLRLVLQIAFILIALYLSFIIISMMTAIGSTIRYTDSYKKRQVDYIAMLEQKYANGEMLPVDEDTFTTFKNSEITDEVLLNQIQYLATHNSYKRELNEASYFCFNYAIPFAGLGNGPTAYNYGHENLTEQFNNGVRSIELDISRRRNGELQCMHNTLLDSNSNNINFELTFKEMKMWSQNNPNHLPIMILVEPKNGSFIFDTKDATAEDIAKLGDMAKEILGDILYTPNDMLSSKGATDFKDLADNNLYPSLNETRGKIMFMLHPSKATTSYIELDKTIRKQTFFPMHDGKDILKDNSLLKYSCFVLSNDPLDGKSLSTLTNDYNMIVRTRMDIYPNHQDANYKGATSSNANILSSDFPPRTNPNGENYVAYLDKANKKTITLKPRNK